MWVKANFLALYLRSIIFDTLEFKISPAGLSENTEGAYYFGCIIFLIVMDLDII